MWFTIGGPRRPCGSACRWPGVVVDVGRPPYRDGLTSSVPLCRSRHPRGADLRPRYPEDHHEAAVSAQRAQAGEEARVPCPYEHPWRTRRVAFPSSEGSRPPVGMIGRLSGREAFARLRAEGVRHGRGPIRLVSRFDPDAANARIAFAIPRSVGNAVVRNRIRRRVRGVLHELHRADAACPPPGDHLIRVTAPIDGWPSATLRHTMHTLLCSDAGTAGGRAPEAQAR